jgi:oligopeptide/dipeptide ABC transporter ATP-binding protein
VRDLAVSFALRDSPDRVRAIDGIIFTLDARQTLAIVGESGSGKSVTALAIMRLLPRPQARIDRGSIHFASRDLQSLSEKQMLAVRGREIAMIFQEPMTSLNPVFTIGEQIIEAILLHQPVSRREAALTAIQSLVDVGITSPSQRLNAYPHEFSGGMRQRVMIAMALACRPRLLLADEPTTALDVTIQRQILDLLKSIQQQRGMAVLLISHDLGVVAHYADAVAVMYAGRIVERASARELFSQPLHPYTRALLAAIPKAKARQDRLRTIDAVMSDPSEFRRLRAPDGRDYTPWWPSHASVEPSGLPMSIEFSPGHCVLCRPAGDVDRYHVACA